MINYIALVIALAISGVSGFYSITGLTTLFSGAYYPVLLMGTVLELGKLTTASWLYNNWNITSRVLKYYLTATVIVLMFISSMGTFGFLSKAHIEQTLQINSGAADQIKIIDTKIQFENQSISEIDHRMAEIDSAISKMTERGKALSSLSAAKDQKKNRDDLTKEKQKHVQNISQLTEERIKLDTEVRKLEAEVGPLRYIAELIYGKASNDQLEKAVRYVIILIVLVFDPLAVVLLIAANVGIKSSKNKKQYTIDTTYDNIKDKVLHLGDI